jgi:hypothetical protein
VLIRDSLRRLLQLQIGALIPDFVTGHELVLAPIRGYIGHVKPRLYPSCARSLIVIGLLLVFGRPAVEAKPIRWRISKPRRLTLKHLGIIVY